jgi:type II secretory pathway pseudopilin PulG
MPTTPATRLRAEHGASPISLLAIVASLVIIAVIAVPALKSGASSSSQTGQAAAATAAAQDEQAQTLLETGQTAMATYAASNGSGYSGVSPSALSAIEPTLITASSTEAYITSASGTATSYTLVSVNPLTHDTFTLSNNGGAVSRTCAPAGRGGCSASGTF